MWACSPQNITSSMRLYKEVAGGSGEMGELLKLRVKVGVH